MGETGRFTGGVGKEKADLCSSLSTVTERLHIPGQITHFLGVHVLTCPQQAWATLVRFTKGGTLDFLMMWGGLKWPIVEFSHARPQLTREAVWKKTD